MPSTPTSPVDIQALDARAKFAEQREWMALWRKHGGGVHGPNVETVTMPQEQFWNFMAEAGRLHHTPHDVAGLREALEGARPAVLAKVRTHQPWTDKVKGRVNPWQPVLDKIDAALSSAVPAEPAVSDAQIRREAVNCCMSLSDAEAERTYIFRESGLVEMVRAIEAAIPQARAPSPAGGWRGIESAPKDGSKVLVTEAGNADRIWVAWYEDGEWRQRVGGILLDLTHWRPLPTPPAHGSAGSIDGGE